MKCFYHNDLDGRASGAVVNLFHENRELEECTFFEMEYSKQFPLELINEKERVYIVDFHVQNENDFRKIQEITKNITLIDHHKSTVKHQQEQPELYKGIEAIIEEAHSGCWLTYKYFGLDLGLFDGTLFPPTAIQLIDDMDRWQWQYGERTANFCEGMKLYPHQPEDEIWQRILKDNTNANDTVMDIIDKGKVCVQYANMICEDYVNSYGFETEFDGYKAFAQGLYKYGSKVFGGRIKKYPLCLSFEFTGKKYIIGLYSETIDVSEIAMRHGGGGHKNAAGFVCDNLPFKML